MKIIFQLKKKLNIIFDKKNGYNKVVIKLMTENF